jgi:hypothetical protein
VNADDVRARVEQLRAAYDASGDDETCHADEDELHRDVLKAIADGAPDPAGLAREAIRTDELTFARWYA